MEIGAAGRLYQITAKTPTTLNTSLQRLNSVKAKTPADTLVCWGRCDQVPLTEWLAQKCIVL